MLPQWSVPNNHDLGTYDERVGLIVPLPVLQTFDLTTEIISGALPGGLRLEGITIVGTPFEVAKTIKSRFVVRGSTQAGITDRTFSMTINGVDAPQFITAEGELPIGANNQFFIIDASVVDFSLQATDSDIPAGDNLEFFIADNDGELPPGLQLTTDGRIVGIVAPLPILEFNASNGYFDEQGFDSEYFDFAYPEGDDTPVPRKINRNFEFVVTVKDNESFIKRRFVIYIVADDFLRADSLLMKSSTNVFTADGTFLRSPIWITPENLGIKRANNYVTLMLDTILAQGIEGRIAYFLEAINPDSTVSRIPPGLKIDTSTGEIAGIVPYFPALTEEYKFTVNAVRIFDDNDIISVFGTFVTNVDTGARELRVAKVAVADLQRLIGQLIPIESEYYKVDTIDTSNTDYDILNIDRGLVATDRYAPLIVAKEQTRGNTHFFVDTLNENDKKLYEGKTIALQNFKYEIDSIYPYVEYLIQGTTIELVDSTNDIPTALNTMLEYNGRITYVEEGAGQLKIIIPATAQNRNKNYIESLFAGNVTVREKAQFDRVLLKTGIVEETLLLDSSASFGLLVNDFFEKQFAVTNEEIAEKSRTFTLQIVGEVETAIEWDTDADLGSIKANRTSDLFLKAKSNAMDSVIKYNITTGTLPTGLTLQSNGDIIGKVPVYASDTQKGLTFFDTNRTTFDGGDTTFDRKFNFNVKAGDRFGYASIDREFTLVINDDDLKNYSNVFAQPFLVKTQKDRFIEMIGDSAVIPPQYIYRPSDPNYGLRKDLRTLIFGGLETKTLAEFMAVTTQNHSKKRFGIGGLKNAIAKLPGTNDVLYEVIYLELNDPYKPTTGKSPQYIVSKSSKKISADSGRYGEDSGNVEADPFVFRPNGSIITVDNTAAVASNPERSKFYLTSIDGMKDQLSLLGDEQTDFTPLWMRTAQGQSLAELGYVLAVPLVYCKPNTSEIVKNNIVAAGYDFSFLDYEIDRYIVDSTTGNNQEQYVIFGNYVYNI